MRPLFKGGVYYNEAPSMQLLLNQVKDNMRLTMHIGVFSKSFKRAKVHMLIYGKLNNMYMHFRFSWDAH